MTFTPTDTANYTNATAGVTITVDQGDAGHHLADAGDIVYGDGARRDAAERDDGARAGHLRLHAAAGRC